MKIISTNIILALFLFGCGSGDNNKNANNNLNLTDEVVSEAPVSKDIIETAKAAGNFTTLLTAINEAGLSDTLKSEGPFTVFAPTDDAFAKIPSDVLTGLLADKAALTNVLTYHVTSGAKKASEVVALSSVDMLNGDQAIISLQGADAFISNAKIIVTDIVTSNGVIHVIDSVILPPQAESQDESTQEEAPQEQAKNIVETAKQAGAFNTLLAALEAADLTSALEGEGPFTVFAPTDAAFAKIPEATLQSLLQDKEALANILTYHVVAEQLDASAVVASSELHMLNGSSAKISLENGPMIENANIIQTDIQTTNGIIHVIDTVILP